MTIFKLDKEQSEQLLKDLTREATKEELYFWNDALKMWKKKKDK